MRSLKERLAEAVEEPERFDHVLIDLDECAALLALLAAANYSVHALAQAHQEGGGSGYYAQKVDQLTAAIAAIEEAPHAS